MADGSCGTMAIVGAKKKSLSEQLALAVARGAAISDGSIKPEADRSEIEKLNDSIRWKVGGRGPVEWMRADLIDYIARYGLSRFDYAKPEELILALWKTIADLTPSIKIDRTSHSSLSISPHPGTSVRDPWVRKEAIEKMITGEVNIRKKYPQMPVPAGGPDIGGIAWCVVDDVEKWNKLWLAAIEEATQLRPRGRPKKSEKVDREIKERPRLNDLFEFMGLPRTPPDAGRYRRRMPKKARATKKK